MDAKKLLLIFIVGIFCINLALAGTVTRSFSKTALAPSELVNVTLNVVVSPGETFYAVDEILPSGFSITSNDGGDTTQAGHIKWVVISGATSTSYTYTAQASSSTGSYNFSGTYQFEGGSETNIAGSRQVNVSVSLSPTIKINELETNPVDETQEYVELYNPNAFSVDISNWSLTDSSVADVDYIPLGTSIPALGYFVFEETISTLSFNNNDSITLKDINGAIIDQTGYLNDALNNNLTWQRIPNGVGAWQLLESTKGSANIVPAGDITMPNISNVESSTSSNSAEISWTTDESANSTIYYGITQAFGEIIPNINFLLSHVVNISSLLSNTKYYYKIISCDISGNCANSSVYNFTTQILSGAENVTDDLMVNYLRGKITIEGSPAPEGTRFQVLVLTGANAGYAYNGSVDDSNIPDGFDLKDKGYFDTNDRIKFNTGDSFKIDAFVEGYICDSFMDEFENGGNGDFNDEITLLAIECSEEELPPVFSAIPNQTISENQTLTINLSAYASDPNGDSMTYGTSASFGAFDSATGIFSWTPDFGQHAVYSITFNVTDGNFSKSQTIIINVTKFNRPPILGVIENQTLIEDSSFSVIVNASDADSDSLAYDVTNMNSSQVRCSIISLSANSANLTFAPASNWSGNASCTISVSDGALSASQVVYITVNSVDDAPILSPISNISISEGAIASIFVPVSDIDSENITYSINDSRFVDNGNGNFTWQTSYNDSGIYYFNISVTDGVSIVSQIVRVEILNSNQLPVLVPLNDITILEDSDWTFAGEVNATDPDGTITGFNIAYQNANEVECSVNSSGTILVMPHANFFGSATCIISALDNLQGKSNISLKINVTNTPDAPAITSLSPDYNPRLLNSTSQLFRIFATDADNDALNFLWFLDGILSQSGTSNSYTHLFVDSGEYNLTAVVSDGIFNESRAWQVFVGSTSDFTCSEVHGSVCGAKEYCSSGWINVSDSSRCCSSSCSPMLFNEIEVCEIKNSNISIEIDSPDENDEFQPGENISLKVEIENFFAEDLDFNVRAYLYNLDDDEIVEEDKDSVDVDSQDDEKINFKLEIPEDVDSGDDYAVYVKVYDRDNKSICNDKYVKVDVEREDHQIKIQDAILDADSASCGDIVRMSISLLNIGEKESSGYVLVENQELAIKEKSETFDLEEYGEHDEIIKEIYLKIPDNAAEGFYNFVITAYYEGKESKFEKEVKIDKCGQGRISSSAEVIQLDSTSETEQPLEILPSSHTSTKPASTTNSCSIQAEELSSSEKSIFAEEMDYLKAYLAECQDAMGFALMWLLIPVLGILILMTCISILLVKRRNRMARIKSH